MDDLTQASSVPERINRDIPIPLYYQISQILRARIETGELGPGDHIPTEKELQEQFDVSRATVRKAISELVYAGMLERQRAIGTVVAKTKLEETLYGFGSFTTEMVRRGMTPQSKTLNFDIIPAPDDVATYLEVEVGEKLVAVQRLRIVDDQPMAVEDWYAPAKFLPGINRSFFKETGKEQSTYYLLQQTFGIPLWRARDTISAVALEPQDAHLLNLDKGVPVLRRTRTSYDRMETPVVYSSGLYVITLILELDSNKTPMINQTK